MVINQTDEFQTPGVAYLLLGLVILILLGVGYNSWRDAEAAERARIAGLPTPPLYKFPWPDEKFPDSSKLVFLDPLHIADPPVPLPAEHPFWTKFTDWVLVKRVPEKPSHWTLLIPSSDPHAWALCDVEWRARQSVLRSALRSGDRITLAGYLGDVEEVEFTGTHGRYVGRAREIRNCHISRVDYW